MITIVAYFVFVLRSFYLRCYFFCLHGSAAAPTGRISVKFDIVGAFEENTPRKSKLV